MKYSKLVKDKSDQDDAGDDDLAQQRVYDMPSSSDSDSDSDSEDESDEELVPVAVTVRASKPVAAFNAPNLKSDRINVDDI